jgi:(1->4)-alpha-D-glucan 1-alpha-D-glucosylmutase
MEVSGPHRDHVIAFARRHGHHAVISAVARWFAPLTNGGRAWPRGEAFDGTLHIDGYAVKGFGQARSAATVPLSDLFHHLPVAVLKARSAVAARPARKSAQMA